MNTINWNGVKSQIIKGDWIALIILVAHWMIFIVHQFIAPSQVTAALLGISFLPAMLVPAIGIAVYIEKTSRWWTLVLPFVASVIGGLIFAKLVDPFMDFWLLYAFFVFLVPAVALTYYGIRATQIKWTGK
jgi:hypothetical protein